MRGGKVVKGTGGEARGGEGRELNGNGERDAGPAGRQVPAPPPHWQKTGVDHHMLKKV